MCVWQKFANSFRVNPIKSYLKCWYTHYMTFKRWFTILQTNYGTLYASTHENGQFKFVLTTFGVPFIFRLCFVFVVIICMAMCSVRALFCQYALYCDPTTIETCETNRREIQLFAWKIIRLKRVTQNKVGFLFKTFQLISMFICNENCRYRKSEQLFHIQLLTMTMVEAE